MKIHSAMIAVMRDIGHIGKSSRNQAQNFNFRGIDAVYNELHSLLAKHGVVTIPIAGTPTSEERTNKNGTVLRFVTLPMTYRFVAEDGSFIESSVIGEAMDSGDKAINKAMAIAHKYALLQTFLIPTEEQKDPDHETHEVVARLPKIDWSKKVSALMTKDSVSDSVIFEFLANKGAKLDYDIEYIPEIPVNMLKRLTEIWDEVVEFSKQEVTA